MIADERDGEHVLARPARAAVARAPEPLGPHALALLALGRALAAEGERPGAVLDRLGTALEHVAGLGALHAGEVQRLLEATLAALGDRRPRLAATVDLLRRLAQDANAPVSAPAARAWLEALPPRSRSGRLARAALAVTGYG